MRIPTVTIMTANGPVIINQSEFDPATMTLATADEAVVQSAPPLDENGLRLDGPTIAEFVAAGYPVASYPPDGYASRSTAEEIAAFMPQAGNSGTTAPAAPATPVVERPALVVGKSGKKFVVMQADGSAYVNDKIDAKGYASEKDAWDAVMALNN